MYDRGVAEILPRFDFRASFAVALDIGRVRERFEDAHLAAPQAGLFIVADGIGGHAGGAVAARIAVETARESFLSARTQALLDAYATAPSLERRQAVLGRLRRAVETAHEAVQAQAARQPELTGMGTTLDVVCLLRDKVLIAHVGDGRVYLARSQATLLLTQDHTDFALMKARGQLRATARPSASQRLSCAVGLGQSPVADCLCMELGKGDRLLLCTDGVYGQIDSEGQLTDLLREGSPQQAAQSLVQTAGLRGRDNATALVIDIEDSFVKRAQGDRALALADLRVLRDSALLQGLSEAALLFVLAAAIEVSQEVDSTVGQAVASDLAAYIVLDGLLELGDGRRVSTGALVFPESLVGVPSAGLAVVRQRARLLRIRHDDFDEVCGSDPKLGLQLYRRLAEHLARAAPPTPPSQVPASRQG